MKLCQNVVRWLLLVIIFGAWPMAAVAEELVLYTMPPPHNLDWSSPRSLVFGAAVANRFTFSHIKHKHTFGHVFVELRDAAGNSDFAGSTTAPDAPSDADFITKQGYGLSVFFANFKGAIEGKESLIPQINDRYKSGRIGFVVFKITPRQYERVARYLKEYRERGYGKVYNGLNLPREGLGAGCSAFGVAFLDVLGLIRPEFEKNWKVSVLLPNELLGGPGTGKRVSLWKTCMGRWAKPGEPSRPLVLYDPDLIFSWIHKIWEQKKFQQLHEELANPQGDYLDRVQLIKRGQALGLGYDVTRVPVPRDPIWQGAAAKK